MRVPSEENETDLAIWVWLSNGPITVTPVSASYTLMVLSSEPETMRVPSGENETELIGLVWPCKGPVTTLPVSASHTRIV